MGEGREGSVIQSWERHGAVDGNQGEEEAGACEVFLNHTDDHMLPCYPLALQVFPNPPLPEEAMVTMVDDWVNFYINYYRKQMVGEQQEQERALQELEQELRTLSAPFLTKYRAFLKSL